MFWKTILIINSFSLGAPILALAQACRSEIGGYCFSLAAISQNAGVGASSQLADVTGNMLESIYVYGLGLVGISALIMLVFGGLKYMTATDSPGQVNSAKDTMRNAILGLVLALVSWLILFTINPDLVMKLDLKLKDVTVQKTEDGSAGANGAVCNPAFISGACPTGLTCTPEGSTFRCRPRQAPTGATRCNPALGAGACPSGFTCVQVNDGKSPPGECKKNP